MRNQQQNKTDDQILMLLSSVYGGIDKKDLTPKRRMKLWDWFTSRLASAAQTPDLPVFFERFCKKTQSTPVKTKKVADILEKGEDDILLTSMRNETTYHVTRLRVQLDERREQHERQ